MISPLTLFSAMFLGAFGLVAGLGCAVFLCALLVHLYERISK